MNKKMSLLSIFIGLCLLLGCGQVTDNHPLEWIPDTTPALEGTATGQDKTETNPQDNPQQNNGPADNTIPGMTVTDSIFVPEHLTLYTTEELYNALEGTDGRTLADMLWDNQRLSGLYDCSLEKLKDKNLLTYYVSFSEGDDNNSGKTPDQPKKTLDMFNGISNVNILLKCGDTFPMTDTFWLGGNVILASYGEGSRPVLDYYQPLEVAWKEVPGCTDVWSADLKNIVGLYNGTKNKSDCNIGHLLLNGKCNWKRLVKADGEDYSYPDYLAIQQDDGFAVDWEQSIIYLHSAVNPNQQEIQYALPQHAVSIHNVMRSQVQGVEIKGAGFHGISVSEAADITVSNCYIHHIGGGLLRDRGPRYGNAVELWDTGIGLTVTYNIAEWIYDTCYTNQGSATSMVQQDLNFSRNLGRYSFWGIETWGDGTSANEFKNIVYEDNILMYACDVTNPEIPVYVNASEQTLDGNGKVYSGYPAYLTYRGNAGSYPYNQMSLLNAANSRTKDSLEIRDNLFLGTNRLLTLLKLAEDGKTRFVLEENLFYAEVPKDVCVFRYTDAENRRVFLQNIVEENNLSLVQLQGSVSEDITTQAVQELKQKLKLLGTGIEE